MREGWPDTPEEMIRFQDELGRLRPSEWVPPPGRPPVVGGCFVCFVRGGTGAGAAGDAGWAGAALFLDGKLTGTATVAGEAGAPYAPGLLGMREGALLARAVERLPAPPELLLVNATGRDHPRHAGLAVHLGHLLDLPTVGVTDRPLLAVGAPPENLAGSRSPLLLAGELIGWWFRPRPGIRPLVVHAGWRTSSETALAVVTQAWGRSRTPQPLQAARRMARTARGRGA